MEYHSSHTMLVCSSFRYLIDDQWPANGVPPKPQVVNEDDVLGAAFEAIAGSEEEADRRLIMRLRERTSHLDTQLRALKLAGAASEKGIKIKPSNLSQLTREQQGEAEKYVGVWHQNACVEVAFTCCHTQIRLMSLNWKSIPTCLTCLLTFICFLISCSDQPEMMRFENEKLREEMERLKRVLGPGPQGANQKLLQENALLVSQVSSGQGSFSFQ